MTCKSCNHEFCLYDLQPCSYRDNHFRKALFPCVCGQFGTYTKQQLYTGLERQRRCVPLLYLKGVMAAAFRVNIFLRCAICWILGVPLTFVFVPLACVFYVLTLPLCWCKL